MSATALQRVVVRMLFDSTFCQAVYADPTRALQAIDLTPQERQWLVTPDPRAYQTDAYRSSRALSGLLEEYPVAGAVALRCQQGLQRLHGFFTSAYFHGCIQERGSLAQAFGAYLGSPVFREQRDVARLAAVELAIAQVRRAVAPQVAAAETLSDEATICLAPWVVLFTSHPRTLPYYSAILERLQRHNTALLEAVLDPELRLPTRPSGSKGARSWVMVVGTPGEAGASLEQTSEELGTLLAATRQAISLQEFVKVAGELGAAPHEALEMLQEFLAERLIVRLS